MLIDTHCHLNDESKFPNVEEEIDLAREAGVHRMIVVGVKPQEWRATVKLAESHEELFCILGWHPNYTAEYDITLLDRLVKLAESPRCLAIGEIGLDYHWDHSPREIQVQALNDQLDLAERLDLPVVFHARDAYSDLLDVLGERPTRPYLFHCFAGSEEEAVRAMALDAYFGVDGPISYKNSEDLKDVVRALPLNRIVVETDAPYLCPVPYRGKQNHPAYVRFVNKALAETLGISESDCAAQTTANAVSFFGAELNLV